MKMIPESIIEQVIEQFENETLDYALTMREFAGRQPAILAFLMAEQEGVLTEDEQDFLLYLATVIWKTVELSGTDMPKVTPGEISDAEEKNWEIFGQSKAPLFHERLDVFFENTVQEDLLAFVEDVLTIEDEEEEETDTFQITPEGREPMFIALKTVIDVLTADEEG
jgi:hypothetical protein